MFAQTFFTVMTVFVLYVIGKFLMKLYNEHLDRMDSSNDSLRRMAENMEEAIAEKHRREKQLAKRKLDIERKRAYEQGRKEAIESGKVTPLRTANSYAAFKNGDVPLNGEQPADYNRAQNFD